MEAKEEKKLRIKKILKAVANYSAIVWAIGVVGVIAILAVATKFLTHDPDFSPGDPEYIYLLPMLSFLFVGGAAFGLMLLTGIGSLFIKGKEDFKPPLGISIKKVILVVVLLFAGAFAVFFGFSQANRGLYKTPTGNFTGQQTFDAVNEYRQKNGLKPLALNMYFCDDLVQRYLDLTNPDATYAGHAGFERWIEKNKESFAGIAPIAELYMKNTTSPQAAIDWWNGSPSHRLVLLGDFNVGCAYADKGTAVVMVGKKQ